jgi:hypothetical protein
VKEYTSAGGEKRIWFDDDEIELMMEDELRRGGLMPTDSNCVVDLEALLDDHLRVSSFDQHADLPPDVLGLTEFDPRQAPTVKINKDLTGIIDGDWIPPGIEGRWRATVAHEAAHVVLHRMLFNEPLNQESLFAADAVPQAKPALQRCLKRDLRHRAGNYDWREVQANRGMAALLMPRKLFTRVARSTLKGTSPQEIRDASRSLATRFGVSGQAATIRLNTLGFVTDQDALDFEVEP